MRRISAALLMLLTAGQLASLTRYTLPHLVTAYRDGDDRMVVEIAYAIPRSGLAAAGGKRDHVNIEQTMTAVDTLGNTFHESWARPSILHPAGTRGLRANYLVAFEQILLPPEEVEVHVGVLDLKVKSTGSLYATCIPPGADGRFDISELLLATDIEVTDTPPLARHSLNIQPNPLRLYEKGERVFVFLELYNLARDTFGQSRFEIAYQMQRPDDEELDASLFEAMDRSGDREDVEGEQPYLVPSKHRSGLRVEKTWSGDEAETTIATQYIGDGTTDLTFLEFDVSQLAGGIHKLTIVATDLQVTRSVSKDVLFRVID